MPDALSPYPAYKDSGVPWLGRIPAHWEVQRLKRICRFIYGDSLSAENRMPGDVPVFGSNGRVGWHNIANTLQPCLVIGRKGSFGKVNYSSRQLFAIDTTFYVDSRSTSADLRWLSYSLNWVGLDAVSRDSAVPGLDREEAYQKFLPLPPIEEQHAITRYLDHIDRRIRRYIRAKQKLIALLEEQKRAVIHQAVTGQIDVRAGRPYLAYKPSGVEWLGNVPEHWEMCRLKNVAQVQTGLTLGKNYGSSDLTEYPYLRVANVQSGFLDLKHVATVRIPHAEAAGCQLQYGDVLMTEGGDRDKLGRGCVWYGEIEGCLHQNHVFAVRADPARLLPEFLVLLMASGHGRSYFEQTAKQTTNLASTNSTTLRAFPLFLPDISEQRLLLDQVVSQTESLMEASAAAQREIALLREYRIRLIADVVTGQVDVRAAAAQLPAEVEEFDALDEAEAELVEDEEGEEQLDAGEEMDE